MRSLVLAAACMFATLQAVASPVVYEYTGSVATILEYQIADGNVISDTSVSTTTMTPAQVALGDTFRGRFTYDPDLPVGERTAHEAYYGSGWQPAPASLVQFDAGNGQYTSSAWQPRQSVFNDQVIEQHGPADTLFVLPYGATDDNRSLVFMFDDASASAFGSTDLPGTIDLSRFDTSLMQFTLYDPAARRGVNVIGSITGLTLVSAVPEPSTWALALAGLVTVAWRVRRR